MNIDGEKNILFLDFDNLVKKYNRLREVERIIFTIIKERLESYKVKLYTLKDDKLGFNFPDYIRNGDAIYPMFSSRYEFDREYINKDVFYEIIDNCARIFSNTYDFDLIANRKYESVNYYLSNHTIKRPISIFIDAKHDDNSYINIIVSYYGIDMTYSGDSRIITLYDITYDKSMHISNSTIMTFSEAYKKMIEGYKITRPGFNGYWYIDSNNGKVTIYTNNKEFTSDDITVVIHNIIQNTAATDWIVVE